MSTIVVPKCECCGQSKTLAFDFVENKAGWRCGVLGCAKGPRLVWDAK